MRSLPLLHGLCEPLLVRHNFGKGLPSRQSLTDSRLPGKSCRGDPFPGARVRRQESKIQDGLAGNRRSKVSASTSHAAASLGDPCPPELHDTSLPCTPARPPAALHAQARHSPPCQLFLASTCAALHPTLQQRHPPTHPPPCHSFTPRHYQGLHASSLILCLIFFSFNIISKK